jgi:hypothetical protein
VRKEEKHNNEKVPRRVFLSIYQLEDNEMGEHVECVGRNTYRILVGKSEGEISLLGTSRLLQKRKFVVYAMKTHREARIHLFLTSTLDRNQLLAPSPSRSNPGERVFVTH